MSAIPTIQSTLLEICWHPKFIPHHRRARYWLLIGMPLPAMRDRISTVIKTGPSPSSTWRCRSSITQKLNTYSWINYKNGHKIKGFNAINNESIMRATVTFCASNSVAWSTLHHSTLIEFIRLFEPSFDPDWLTQKQSLAELSFQIKRNQKWDYSVTEPCAKSGAHVGSSIICTVVRDTQGDWNGCAQYQWRWLDYVRGRAACLVSSSKYRMRYKAIQTRCFTPTKHIERSTKERQRGTRLDSCAAHILCAIIPEMLVFKQQSTFLPINAMEFFAVSRKRSITWQQVSEAARWVPTIERTVEWMFYQRFHSSKIVQQSSKSRLINWIMRCKEALCFRVRNVIRSLQASWISLAPDPEENRYQGLTN